MSDDWVEFKQLVLTSITELKDDYAEGRKDINDLRKDLAVHKARTSMWSVFLGTLAAVATTIGTIFLRSGK